MQSPDLLTYNFQEKYSFQEQNLPQIIPREGIVKVSGRRENCDKIKFKTACSNLQTYRASGGDRIGCKRSLFSLSRFRRIRVVTFLSNSTAWKAIFIGKN